MMGKQRRIPSTVPWIIGMAVAFIPFLLTGCGEAPPGSPNAKTILSASDADRVAVQPGGRRIIFWPKDPPSGLMMLDVSTGEKVQISKDIGWAWWLDDELLYGEQFSLDPVNISYVINLQPVAIVRLEALTSAPLLPERIREADRIYAIVTETLNENVKYLLLLLRLDADRRAVGGYAVHDVRDLDALLAGHPYKTIPPFSYQSTAKQPLPDGEYYYICDGFIVNPLRIYSQQGELLNFVGASAPESGIVCYGWAWDGSGVFFQEIRPGPAIGHRRIGPFQVLEVEP